MKKTTTETQNGRTLAGTIVKASMQDTVTVAVTRYVQHPKYKKYIRRTKKFLVHAPGTAKVVGDKVMITESKPISKRKHFVLIEA